MRCQILNTVFKQQSRKFSTSHRLRSVEDPMEAMTKSLETEAHHAQKLKWALYVWAVATPLSVLYAAYHEYHHEWTAEKVHRPKFIPYRFYSVKRKNFPFGDGDHTPMFNPKKNFTAKGYETDDYGRPLPKD